MGNRNRAKKATTVAWIGFLLCATVVGTLAAYVRSQPDLNGHPGKASRNLSNDQQNAINKQPNHETVLVLSPRYENGDLSFDSQTTTVPSGQNSHVFAVNEYLRTSHVAPEGAALLSIKMDGTTATLDFNSAFNTTYGTDDERTLLNGILKTLGQFHEIEKVLFTVEGKQYETMGNVDLTEPQPVLR